MLKLQITLPISAERLGRWLEDNHAEIRIMCMLGEYHVYINRHVHESHVEKGSLSVTRSRDVEVFAHGKEIEAVLMAALEKCGQENV